jgi:hypothetical protein
VEVTKMGDTPASLAGWLARNRLRLQAAVLVAVTGASFALYVALQAGQDALAAACFALVALSFAAALGLS